MKNSYVEEIFKSYQETRKRQAEALRRRKAEVYEKIPRLKSLDGELAATGARIARIALSGESDAAEALDALRTRVEAIRRERAFLLTEGNFPLSYLELQHDCPKCGDTGYLPAGKRCPCFKQKLIRKAYRMSNIEAALQRENFQTFDIDRFSDEPFGDETLSPRQNMMEILSHVEGFVHGFSREQASNLLLYGQSGLGKTFLCNCIAKALLDKGHIVVYQTAFRILEILEKHKFSREKDPDIELAYGLLFDADLLIIDDLGTEMPNAFTNSELFNILNSRLLAKKKTVISTNLSPLEIANLYSQRISSRIMGHYHAFEFYGKDLRWEV